MEIGTKIKNARTRTGLTQEAVAESLGVSRQTISNWENGKFYPDIVSVIKMSDLYSVSLDHLLKEESEMKRNLKEESESKQTYMDYLEESTDTVRSREKLTKLILIIVPLLIWAIALIVFWFLMDAADAGAYSLVFLWLILPVTIFVVSLIAGKRYCFGKATFLSIPFFGIMYMISEYATFSMANTVKFGHFNMPEFTMIPVGMFISSLGVGIGLLARRKKKK